MHGVGHNFGLSLSSDTTDPIVAFGDRSGMMGISYSVDDGPGRAKMCFNAAKSYTIGWYSDKTVDLDPATSSFTGRLAGVGKYPTIAANEDVVLKLTHSSTDYFVGYNHAVGAHEGTNEAINQVTVVSQVSTDEVSFLVARLSAGQSHIISNFDGSEDDLTINVVSIDTSATGYADVQVYLGALNNGTPTSSPTSGRTSAPTSDPTSAPTFQPTSGPTSRPTSGPTSEPTSIPSSIPSVSPTSTPSLAPTAAPTDSPASPPSSAPILQKRWRLIVSENFEDGLGNFIGDTRNVKVVRGGRVNRSYTLSLHKEGKAELTSNPDVQMYEKLRLQFQSMSRATSTFFYVEIRVNSGQWHSWGQVDGARAWKTTTLQMNMSSAIQTVQFRFKSTLSSAQNPIFVDNVKFQGYC
uniref:Peptidase M11 gametolysin domain-containing protein n=1 Tax=Pseudictyota dubia TaxID=2749911 RepID=A0A7R9W4V4_9STRA